ncbi:hypothetical protein, partial [uncultured Allobaculum sp.]|uniref:hypothetical protein n=1 Tax=uncultured Allobaculum sp. TaxID=1187017 RepID=UPI0025978B07
KELSQGGGRENTRLLFDAYPLRCPLLPDRRQPHPKHVKLHKKKALPFQRKEMPDDFEMESG